MQREKPDGVSAHQETLDSPTNVRHQEAGSLDVALQLVSTSVSNAVTEEQNRRVLGKIDFCILPLLMFSFMLQYVDKVILNGASQFGIVQDLKLYHVSGFDAATGKPILDLHRYANATVMFYWGCLAGRKKKKFTFCTRTPFNSLIVIPGAFLAQRLPIAKFLGCTIIVWGAVVILTVLVCGYQGFLVQRFFLGFTECSVAPGFSIIIAMWWKKQEQSLRFCLWYTSTGLGGLFGSLLIFGIGHIKGSLAPWKYQYLILGGFTVAWGMLVLILLPDNETTARFLSAEEKRIAVERMRTEQTGIENKRFKAYQIREALLDPKTWFLVALTLCLTFINGAVSGFGAVIVSSFGYSHLTSVLLLGAVGACVFVTLLLIGVAGIFISSVRTYLLAACEVPVIIGAALVWKIDWSPHKGAAIGGFTLLGPFAGAYIMVLALAGANTAGHTKKVFTSGLLWTSWAVSNGVAPLTIKTQEAKQHYPSGFTAAIATAALTIALSLAFRAYLGWQNNRRDKLNGQPETSHALSVAFLDQTDMENKLFRYVL